jgi:hypothetical protein
MIPWWWLIPDFLVGGVAGAWLLVYAMNKNWGGR